MFKSAMLTKVGGRAVNEDSVRAASGEGSLCAVLADGLGGHGGGDVASALTVDAIMDAYKAGELSSPARLEAAIEAANRRVLDAQTERCQMKSTVVALRLEGERMFWAHVGDSRLYHFKSGRIVSHTRDHSLSQLAVLMGEISEDQIRFHSQRSRILRALGSEGAQPDVTEVLSLAPGETCFLLCSDGFWEYVLESDMEGTMKEAGSPEDWLAAMERILLGKVQPGNDNYSAIAVFA